VTSYGNFETPVIALANFKKSLKLVDEAILGEVSQRFEKARCPFVSTLICRGTGETDDAEWVRVHQPSMRFAVMPKATSPLRLSVSI